MTNDEVIKKLYFELRELSSKIDDLTIFLKTNKFEQIKKEHALHGSLLETQLKQMRFYKDTLIWRISLLKNQNKK